MTRWQPSGRGKTAEDDEVVSRAIARRPLRERPWFRAAISKALVILRARKR
jgi:hypothetical protein